MMEELEQIDPFEEINRTLKYIKTACWIVVCMLGALMFIAGDYHLLAKIVCQ